MFGPHEVGDPSILSDLDENSLVKSNQFKGLLPYLPTYIKGFAQKILIFEISIELKVIEGILKTF